MNWLDITAVILFGGAALVLIGAWIVHLSKSSNSRNDR
jgi:hypothetical protein